jgi:hypothetical protein
MAACAWSPAARRTNLPPDAGEPGQGYCFTKAVVNLTDTGTLTHGDGHRRPAGLTAVTMNASVATTVTCTPPPSRAAPDHRLLQKTIPAMPRPFTSAPRVAGSSSSPASSWGERAWPENLRHFGQWHRKLYAQLLAAKLNILSGATRRRQRHHRADAFLATHNHTDWTLLTSQNKPACWRGTALDNNGVTGPATAGTGSVPRPALTAVAAAPKVTLKWTRAEATSCIDRTTTPGGPYTTIKSASGTNYVDTTCMAPPITTWWRPSRRVETTLSGQWLHPGGRLAQSGSARISRLH